jgi:hypothetical protein
VCSIFYCRTECPNKKPQRCGWGLEASDLRDKVIPRSIVQCSNDELGSFVPILRLPELTCSQRLCAQLVCVALATLCEYNNAGGNQLRHNPVRPSKTENLFHSLAISVRHYLNIGRLKYCIAYRWNYRVHSLARYLSLRATLPLSAGSIWSKVNTFGGCASNSRLLRNKTYAGFDRQCNYLDDEIIWVGGDVEAKFSAHREHRGIFRQYLSSNDLEMLMFGEVNNPLH